jgi:hypothetical protein
MDLTDLKPAVVSLVGAFAASLCCLLPLAVMVLGLGSGAFMATTMRYQWMLLPLGILAVTAGYVWYFRERRRCQGLVCTMAGGRLNLVALGLATAVLLGEVVLVAAPERASQLFGQAMVSASTQVEHRSRGDDREPRSRKASRDHRPRRHQGPDVPHDHGLPSGLSSALREDSRWRPGGVHPSAKPPRARDCRPDQTRDERRSICRLGYRGHDLSQLTAPGPESPGGASRCQTRGGELCDETSSCEL